MSVVLTRLDLVGTLAGARKDSMESKFGTMEKMVHVGSVEMPVFTPDGIDTYTSQLTPEDWYPNWPGDMVRVQLECLVDGRCRCSVWGADDTGMAFDSMDRYDCLWRYEAIGDGVTKAALIESGFVRA